MALLAIVADLMFPSVPSFPAYSLFFFFHLAPTNPTSFLLPDVFDAAQLPVLVSFFLAVPHFKYDTARLSLTGAPRLYQFFLFFHD